MMRLFNCKLISIVSALVLSACAEIPPTSVHQPMTARPAPAPAAAPSNGSIYQASSLKSLFEDRRARNVGDTLVINIEEKTSGSKKSNSSAERTSSVEAAVPTILHLPGKSYQGLEAEASSSNDFEGKGESAANNTLSGTIVVTVIEVLPNGNLLVSGEKQLGINQGTEFIRFSGVVNPININNNTVSSMQVADARVEYRGTGYVNESQIMGWLARAFLSVLPF